MAFGRIRNSALKSYHTIIAECAFINRYFVIFIFSGRKRRGSETLSDSSGDEYYGMNGIISTSTQFTYWNHQQSPSSCRQPLTSTPILDTSSQNNQSNIGNNDGCRSGPVMSECTAALVLMNLSHSPANSTHLPGCRNDVSHSIRKGEPGQGSRALSNNVISPSTQLYKYTNSDSSHNLDDYQSKHQSIQNQKQGHVGHVRCLPGGACLVGSEFSSASSSASPEQQVQGTFTSTKYRYRFGSIRMICATLYLRL